MFSDLLRLKKTQCNAWFLSVENRNFCLFRGWHSDILGWECRFAQTWRRRLSLRRRRGRDESPQSWLNDQVGTRAASIGTQWRPPSDNAGGCSPRTACEPSADDTITQSLTYLFLFTISPFCLAKASQDLDSVLDYLQLGKIDSWVLLAPHLPSLAERPWSRKWSITRMWTE